MLCSSDEQLGAIKRRIKKKFPKQVLFIAKGYFPMLETKESFNSL